MLTKNITYYDLNGDQQTDTLMFNLTTVELARVSKMLAPQNTDLETYLNDIITRNDMLSLLDAIATIMIEASGVKSADGKRFVKNKQTKEDFENSMAFAEYLEIVMGNPEEAMEFIKNVFNSEKVKQELKDVTVDSLMESKIIPMNSSADVLTQLKDEPVTAQPEYSSEELLHAMELLRKSKGQ